MLWLKAIVHGSAKRGALAPQANKQHRLTRRKIEHLISYMEATTIKNGSLHDRSLATGRRALAIVEMVANRRGGYSFSDISEKTGMAPASISRMLKMLVEEDWLHHIGREAPYSAGARLFQLADALDVHTPASDAMAPLVRDLSNRLGHSVCIGTAVNDDFQLLVKTEQRQSYHFIDTLTPNVDWIANAIGFSLLAFQSDEYVERIYRLHYARSITEAERRELAQIRDQREYWREEGHVTRVIAAIQPDPAVPVGHVLAVAALTASRPRPELLVPQVRETAREIEARLRNGGINL